MLFLYSLEHDPKNAHVYTIHVRKYVIFFYLDTKTYAEK